MIYVKATKHLTGVTIQGDLDDFNDLVSAIYRMTGTSEEVGDLYEGVKNRLLGLCYDIRHAYMGDREIVLKDNVLGSNINEEFGIHECNQNIYYSVNILYPEAIFLALAVPDMFVYSKGYYGKRDQYNQEYKMINSYSNYFKDKALLSLLSSSIYQSLEEVIGSDEFNKLYSLINKENPDYVDYVTLYIDQCNLDLIKTQIVQRKDKLIDITRNFIKKNKEYKNIEKRIKAYAHKHQISIDQIEDVNIEYPEVIEW